MRAAGSMQYVMQMDSGKLPHVKKGWFMSLEVKNKHNYYSVLKFVQPDVWTTQLLHVHTNVVQNAQSPNLAPYVQFLIAQCARS